MSGRVLLCVQNMPVPQDPRVWREACDLAAAGYRVSVVCPRGPGQSSREQLAGVDIFRYPAPRARAGVLGQVVETAAALVWTTLRIARLRVVGPVEVLHAANPPDSFVLVAALFRPFGTRFVFDQHDAVPELLVARAGNGRIMLRAMTLLERWSYALADLVISPNESYRALALGRGRKRPPQVVVVRSGPDEVRAVERGPRSIPAVVAFAGTINAQDGVHVLLDAISELLARRPGSVRLEVFGSGDAVPALQERAAHFGIADSVHWAGWVERDELLARLESVTIGVSPDEDSAFNRISTMLKVMDYMSVGLPSVVADLPENRVTGGDAVSYFRPGDAHALAKAIEELIDDPEMTANLAARSRRRGHDLLWEHSREVLLRAYEEVLGLEPAGGRRPDSDNL